MVYPRMMRCSRCWRYTFRDKCPVCGADTVDPHPTPFDLPKRS